MFAIAGYVHRKHWNLISQDPGKAMNITAQTQSPKGPSANK